MLPPARTVVGHNKGTLRDYSALCQKLHGACNSAAPWPGRSIVPGMPGVSDPLRREGLRDQVKAIVGYG